VEGQSEVEAVPILLRRLLAEMGLSSVIVARPFRVKRTKVVRPGELERTVEQAVRSRTNVGAVLLIMDADDDCPAQLGPFLAQRARQSTSVPVSVVLAAREFEAWFLGAKESLRGQRRIRPDAVAPQNPEAIRGAKEELTSNMSGSRYLPVDDQPFFAQAMDIAMARAQCPSLARLFRELERLARHVLSAQSGG